MAVERTTAHPRDGHRRWRRRRRSDRLALDSSLSVFVFRIGRYSSDHGVLGAIRSLGSLGVPVATTRTAVRAPADWSRHLTSRLPFPSAFDDDALVDAFDGVSGAFDTPTTLVVPTDDKAAIFLDEHGHRLPSRYVWHTGPRGVASQLVDKERCAQALARCGLACAPGHVLQAPLTEGDAGSIDLPGVIKRVSRTIHQDGSWSASTLVVHTAEELGVALKGVNADRAKILVQRYIPGRDWLYHAYFDRRSAPAFASTATKVFSDAPGGATALAVTRHNDEVKAIFTALGAELRYVGPISADVREAEDGTLYVLDVNPRLGACFRLFTAPGGLDPLRAYHLEASGRPIPDQRVPDGRCYVVDGSRPPSRRDTRRQIRRARSVERAWRSLADPLPGLARQVSRLRRGRRSSP
jgi:predicted ATP-grasp superfamily ATP-dependent carboligase